MPEHSTEIGNTYTSILPRKSKHIDQLVTVMRDQAATQQHKLGGQILPQQILEISQPFPEWNRATRILQEWTSLPPPQSTLPSFNTDTHIIKIYHSQPSTSYSSHYFHISHSLGPLKGPFLGLSTSCGMVKAPPISSPSTAVTGQNSSNLPRKYTNFFLPITSYTWTRQPPEEWTHNMVLKNVSTMSKDD